MQLLCFDLETTLESFPKRGANVVYYEFFFNDLANCCMLCFGRCTDLELSVEECSYELSGVWWFSRWTFGYLSMMLTSFMFSRFN